ncbi:hypothetical protein RD110_07355 [Rhodoferax koreense]|uniref:Family 65 glycosyl hydrolase n=1 Tax=Rhodoferax koreensis TaxID=1842727 RepID=A0A1P8K3L4_9BURK|nr:glycosyl hydrolase family 65 protein [Rhodoferax koreense]APW40531.1 hypothetical protein RD110_07355 [Rhodoferax koreense]
MSESFSAALETAPWSLRETRPDAASAALHETLFCLGNGRIGVRGAHEEGACWPGTEQDAIYVNGFYDTEDIRYPENGYGLARTNQFIVSLPNAKAVHWWIDDEFFDPQTGRIEDYARTLHFDAGLLTRCFVWVSPRGRRVAVNSTRLVSFERQTVFALRYELRPLDGPAVVAVESFIDASSREIMGSDDPRVGSAHAANALEPVAMARSPGRTVLTQRTRRSGLVVVSAQQSQARCERQGMVASEDCGGPLSPGQRFSVRLEKGESLQLDKVVALVTSGATPVDELADQADTQLRLAVEAGFDRLCEEQRHFLDRFWREADVQIDGDPALQQGLRFNQLHLLQSVGRDGRSNVAAKGVTGSGYDGHYFWDTEIYVFPVMLYTQPAIARKLLEFRYHTLDAARARARDLAHPRGALYPWRTIAGEECSSYFPAGTAQVHINADIAYAVKSYWEVTGDDDFMLQHGAEMVFETARIWLGLGHFEVRKEAGLPARRFCIYTVTGPDEYTALVNNNFYTNAMARMHLAFAVEVFDWLARRHPATLAVLHDRITLVADEPPAWRDAAEHMYLPYDAALGVHPQDDSFTAKPAWADSGFDGARRPLLLHYHALVIYRHRVCKQADVVLALLLLGHEFGIEEKRRDFDYYEPLTTHDSSLSRCIFGIVASEVGYADKAYAYFADGARTDLDDHHGNTRHGVHTAAMAGAWLGVVAGFAGLRMRRSVAAFSPTLPPGWQRYAFKLRLGQAQLQVEVQAHGCRYRLVDGESLRLVHRGEELVLTRAEPERTMPL